VTALRWLDRRRALTAYQAAEDRVAAGWPQLATEPDPGRRAGILSELAADLDFMAELHQTALGLRRLRRPVAASVGQVADRLRNTGDLMQWLGVTEDLLAKPAAYRATLEGVLGDNRFPCPWEEAWPALRLLCDVAGRDARARLVDDLRALTEEDRGRPVTHVVAQVAAAYRNAQW
jgi:hypothetical protein